MSPSQEANPARREANPARRDGNPGQREANPGQHDGNPGQHDGNPGQHDGNPGGYAEPREGASDQEGKRGRLDLTDPKAIRAMAHPLRLAVLEALSQAGTLTATQASEMLGESPANCAFHLRTLAKYGFVEEAGGGRGRERPWRPTFNRLSWPTRHEDPQFAHAAEALDQVWMDRVLTRARGSLTLRASWPEAFGEEMGASISRLYVTPAEARELHVELEKAFERLVGEHHRFGARRDPKLRPPGAVPVEFILVDYPVLDAPPLPEGGETGDDAEADPEVRPPG